MRHVDCQGRQIAGALTMLTVGLCGVFQQGVVIAVGVAAAAAAMYPDVVAVQEFLPHGILPRNVRRARDLEEQ